MTLKAGKIQVIGVVGLLVMVAVVTMCFYLLNRPIDVTITTEKNQYQISETIFLDVKNFRTEPIYAENVCGMPFSYLQKKVGVEWESHAAYPNKNCRAPKFTRFQGVNKNNKALASRSSLNLQIYAHGGDPSFQVSAGVYRFQMRFTANPNTDPVELTDVFSNEFQIED